MSSFYSSLVCGWLSASIWLQVQTLVISVHPDVCKDINDFIEKSYKDALGNFLTEYPYKLKDDIFSKSPSLTLGTILVFLVNIY